MKPTDTRHGTKPAYHDNLRPCAPPKEGTNDPARSGRGEQARTKAGKVTEGRGPRNVVEWK